MNKYQEALNKTNFILRKLSGWSGKDLSEIDNQYDLFNNQALIQELVDKSTPKKPIVQTFKSPYLKSYINKGFCPQCNQEVEEDNCCSNNDCRQAIDWSTDE